MVTTGISLAVLSGLFNGLFTTADETRTAMEVGKYLVRLHRRCLLMMPIAIVFGSSSRVFSVLMQGPHHAVTAALLFGFAWGFGAICFGRSVHSIGVSMANTLVIGLSSALGSLVPLLLKGDITFRMKEFVLFAASHCSPHWKSQFAGRRDGFGMDSKQRESLPAIGYLFALARRSDVSDL